MHYGDLKNWVIKVINSCENYRQLTSARRLVFLFDNHDSHSHLNFLDRQNLKREVFIAYQTKQFELLSEQERQLQEQ